MDDLIARLRAADHTSPLIREAADALTRVKLALERVDMELADLREEANDSGHTLAPTAVINA